MSEKSDIQTHRQTEFDIAKGIAIICVVLGHLNVIWLQNLVYPFHMPLFFLISGYFLSINRPWKMFLKRKKDALLIPYLFTGFVIVAASIPISLLTHRSPSFEALRWLLGVFYGNGTDMPSIFPNIPTFIGALWFLLALFWASLFARLILQYFSGLLAPIAFIILFCLGWSTSDSVWWPWDIQAGMTAALFLYIGYETHTHDLLNRKVPGICVLFVFLFTLGSMYFYSNLEISKNHFGNGIFDPLRAALITWLIILFSKRIDGSYFAKIMSWFGANSIIVLAFHIMELNLISWDKIIQCLLSIGIPNVFAYFFVIAIKIGWASFGIYFVHHSKIMHYVYLRR